ncbi:MAG: flavodoxin-dependent (E)-4-hydroxy-3-methylbut-2-enyl-diphosphate synthase [Oscillospiraceae bacterium]|jgi:(E)-4-hydroxy-3-methylbut-2-enyl-diphosphate synthase|nr:flavodoxin-dependent (E)-4-hydroxy-3-methylbut-2-enyl-diphosphate synthase [Oscillospiraceae bacterium]
MTKQIRVGNAAIGGGSRVTIQSMTRTDTRDREATLKQITLLAEAGADLVRVSVYDEECVGAARYLADNSPVPLIADVHFQYKLAIGALEAGFAKLRINPGNIGSADKVRMVADCAKAHGAPIRVGVNSGSLEKDMLAKHGSPTPEALAESAMQSVRILEKCCFNDIVVAVKTSRVADTIRAYRLVAATCDYPLHLGLTEAGLPEEGFVKSAVAIGSLLVDNIGDTIRVSLSGDPVPEVDAAKKILRAAGRLHDVPDIISCPTCGRTTIDVVGLATRVREAVPYCNAPLRIAVMGCIVNGPGEAREADIGIAGGRDGCALFMKGEPPEAVHGDPVEALVSKLKEKGRIS